VIGTPEVIDHPSPNHSARKLGVRVDTVLLHHTGSSNGNGPLAWLCDPTSGVSAHYMVGPLGVVHRIVSEHRKAWHAGKGRLPWETVPEYDFNHRSIGIEVVNPGDGKTPFTEAQYRALEWLVPGIVRRHGGVGVHALGASTGREALARGWCLVLGHRDVAPGRKTDPADNFDWGRIRAALSGGQS
jgi:N-acetylmuramoyl-L-alanine amidase